MITSVNNCVMHYNFYYLWKLKVNYMLNFIVFFMKKKIIVDFQSNSTISDAYN